MDIVEEWIWEHATKYAFVKILKCLKSKRYTGELPTSWLSALLLSRVQRYWGKSNKIDFRVLINVQDTLISVAKFYGKELQKKVKVDDFICLVLACRAAVLAMRINCDQAAWRKALDEFFPIWSPRVWNKMKVTYGIKDNFLEEELKNEYMQTRKKLFLQKHVKKDILDNFQQKMTDFFPYIISFLYSIQLSILEKIQMSKTNLESNFGFIKEIIKNGIDEDVLLKLLQASQAQWIKQKCLTMRKLSKFKDSDSQISAVPMENVIYLLPAYGSTENCTEIYPNCCDSYPHMPSQVILEETGELQTFVISKDVAVAKNGTKFEPHWFCEVPNGSQTFNFRDVEIKQESDDELTEAKCLTRDTYRKDKTYIISKSYSALKDQQIGPDNQIPIRNKTRDKNNTRRELARVECSAKEKTVNKRRSSSTASGTSSHDEESQDDDKNVHSDGSGTDCSIYYSAHTGRTYMFSRGTKSTSKRSVSAITSEKQQQKDKPESEKMLTNVPESSSSMVPSSKTNRKLVGDTAIESDSRENEDTSHQIESTNTKSIQKSNIVKGAKPVENPINQMSLRPKLSISKQNKSSPKLKTTRPRNRKMSASDSSSVEDDNTKSPKTCSTARTRIAYEKPKISYKESSSSSDSSVEPTDSTDETNIDNQSIGRRSQSTTPKKSSPSPSKRNSAITSSGSKPRDIIINTNVLPTSNVRTRQSKEDAKGHISSPAKSFITSSDDNCISSPSSRKGKIGNSKRKRDVGIDEKILDTEGRRPKRMAGDSSASDQQVVPKVIDTLKQQVDRLRLNAATVSCGKKLDKCIKRIVRTHLKLAYSNKELMNLDSGERILRSQTKGPSTATEVTGSDIADRVKQNSRAAKHNALAKM